MSIELVRVMRQGRLMYAGVDAATGKTNEPFTEFMAWFSAGKSVRKAATRGFRPTSHTVRQYAYRFKRWFDLIDDWNEVAKENEKITWSTARKKHMVHFLDRLRQSPGPQARTRNGLRIVWQLFYENFCPFMGYQHCMTGLSELADMGVPVGSCADDRLLGGLAEKRIVRKSLIKEPENEDSTFRILSLDDVNTLINGFDDLVYAALSYMMFATGLRIGGALQIPYPDTDKKNKCITSPILIMRDFRITDGWFEFKYIYKGHEQVGDYYKCDVPFFAWTAMWVQYRPLQEERLELWRSNMIKKTGDTAYANRYPVTFWLDREGHEVVETDVWKAFRETRKAIREKIQRNFPDVTPHWLRHTYATLMVIDFAEHANLELDPDNKPTVQYLHQYLQEQLGHRWLSTTIKYIKTAMRIVRKRWIPKVDLPGGRFSLTEDQKKNFNICDFQGFFKRVKEDLNSTKH